MSYRRLNSYYRNLSTVLSLELRRLTVALPSFKNPLLGKKGELLLGSKTTYTWNLKAPGYLNQTSTETVSKNGEREKRVSNLPELTPEAVLQFLQFQPYPRKESDFVVQQIPGVS